MGIGYLPRAWTQLWIRWEVSVPGRVTCRLDGTGSPGQDLAERVAGCGRNRIRDSHDPAGLGNARRGDAAGLARPSPGADQLAPRLPRFLRWFSGGGRRPASTASARETDAPVRPCPDHGHASVRRDRWGTEARCELALALMARSLVIWRLLVLLAPVLTIAAASAMTYLVFDLGGDRSRPSGDFFFRAMVWTFAVLAVLVVAYGPVDLRPDVEPVHGLTLLAGVALYEVDLRVARRLYGRLETRRFRSDWIVLLVVVTPLTEEVVYRLAVDVAFGSLGPVGYVALSAGLFAVHHWTFGRVEFVRKFENGVVYAALFVLTGSVVPPIVAHMGYNTGYLLRNRE